MRRQRISAATVREPAPQLWSNCIKVGEIAYVAGMTARGDDGQTVVGEEYEQAVLIFSKIKALLEAAGGSIDDVVKLTIFVTRIEHNAEVWRARAEFFHGDFPACSLVEVSRLNKPEMYVEIEAIAHIGCSTAQ